MSDVGQSQDTLKDLLAFEKGLEAVIGRPSSMRPFVCDGSPLECRAFIVGFNPASASDVDFWEFWRSGVGFDKHTWLSNYLRERQARPLKPGRTRRNPVSNTRKIIDIILRSASPIRCLETNIYSAPSEEAKDLGIHQRLTAPFDFLLSTIKPKVIVAHGKDAIGHVQRLGPDAEVIAVPHFSRGFSIAAAVQLGQKLREYAGDG